MTIAAVYFWLALSVAVGILASRYQREGVLWFLIALVLSPLVGAALLLAAGPVTLARKCPYCFEALRLEAVTCSHCGRDVPKPDPEAVAAAKKSEPEYYV
jgi:hypothetical protein